MRPGCVYFCHDVDLLCFFVLLNHYGMERGARLANECRCVAPPQYINAQLSYRYCTNRDIKWFVVGKGSNCLFDDRGFDGCVILNQVTFLKNLSLGMYYVGSGYPFNQLGIQCSRAGFSGLEFAGGIPGTVGGAIYMNAGADGQV